MKTPYQHLGSQGGAFNLYYVAILSAGLAALCMAALYSMRYEQNIFAEMFGKAGAAYNASPAKEALDSAKRSVAVAAGGNDGVMRSCVIGGKKVISNSECDPKGSNTKVIAIHDTKGFEAPKVPPKQAATPTSNPLIDKIIEKQLQ
jgi:hypothetical protein